MTKVRAQVNEETSKGQLPWGHTNLIGSVYLNGAPAPAAPGAAAAAAARSRRGCTGSDVELEFWRSIKDSNKPEELNAYLTNYPNGQFKSLALARIAALESGTASSRRNPQPDHRHRSRGLHRGLHPDSPRTRSASTRASAATCSAASTASASTPR